MSYVVELLCFNFVYSTVTDVFRSDMYQIVDEDINCVFAVADTPSKWDGSYWP